MVGIRDRDPRAKAIDLVLKLTKVLRNSGIRRAEALARRAKDYPQLMLLTGLVPATTYYISKANEELYKYLYEVLRESEDGQVGVPSGSQKLRESLQKEASGEGGGYTLYLALLGVWLSEYALLNPQMPRECTHNGDIPALARCLQLLRECGMELRAATATRYFVSEAKKLIEALHGE